MSVKSARRSLHNLYNSVILIVYRKCPICPICAGHVSRLLSSPEKPFIYKALGDLTKIYDFFTFKHFVDFSKMMRLNDASSTRGKPQIFTLKANPFEDLRHRTMALSLMYGGFMLIFIKAKLN